jgi:hypothetical protein
VLANSGKCWILQSNSAGQQVKSSQVVLANSVKCWITQSNGVGQHIFQSSGTGQLSQVPDFSAMWCLPTQASAGFYSQIVLPTNQVKSSGADQLSQARTFLASGAGQHRHVPDFSVKCRICQSIGAGQLSQVLDFSV